MKKDTSLKGALAESKVKTDLISKGYHVATPDYNNLPFDIVLITPSFKLYKIQVKYTEFNNNGTATLSLRNGHSTSNGVKKKIYKTSEVDVFALYIKNIDKCFYIPSSVLNTLRNNFTLRFEPSKNNIKSIIHNASEFETLILE